MVHLLEHLVFKGTLNHPNIPDESTAQGARPDGPSIVLMEGLINTEYIWHNYENTTIKNKLNIDRISAIENLKAFYKKYYRPDNGVLMFTGKFVSEKTLAHLSINSLAYLKTRRHL